MSCHEDYFVIFGFLFGSRIRFFFDILNHDAVSELTAATGTSEDEDTTEDIIEIYNNNIYESENEIRITE